VANNPKKELLEWLAREPRLRGWGAIVDYDRNKCNNLLLQDYINKFTTNNYLEPIFQAVPVTDNSWDYMYDWVFDAPRLSFEDSSTYIGGQVNLRKAAVGGTQVTISNLGGPKRAVAVDSIDALDHPELIAEHVELTQTLGVVDKHTGEVVLDLGSPKAQTGEWELTFGNTQHKRRAGGKFLKKYYAKADPEKRLYHLGKVAFTQKQFLKPASFKLRTITAPGGNSRASGNYGDGAVELFIQTEGAEEGGTPPMDDWKSLIPNDVPGQYDTGLLFSTADILPVVGEGVGRALGVENMKYNKHYNGPVTTLVAAGSGLFVKLPASRIHALYNHENIVPLGSADGVGNLTITQDASRRIFITWGSLDSGNDSDKTVRCILERAPGEGGDHGTISVWIHYSAEVGVGYDPASKKVVIKLLDSKVSILRLLPRTGSEAMWNYVIENNAVIISHYEELFRTAASNFLEMAEQLDVFIVNSLLFDDPQNHIQYSEAHMLDGSAVVFGQIKSPFTITTLEHLMGHGASHQFKVSEDFTGAVKWSVAVIPGSTGGTGTINEDSGEYTSPALADIPGTFTRVKVTATDPVTKYSSSALVTVVVRDITVNPLVQICNATDEEPPDIKKLSANTLGEGTLHWKVTTGTGTIPERGTPDPDPEVKSQKNIYTPGAINPDLDGSFTIDEIEVRNLKTDKTQSSFIVVTHYSAELKVTIDMAQSSFPDGKAKLVALDGRNRPVTAIWTVAVGNGSIDSDGVFTGNPEGQQLFALVTAHTLVGGVIDKDGWLIMPWPLLELPDKPADNLLDD
jgi:hypothetical protein